MSKIDFRHFSRRRFFEFIASSPLFAHLAGDSVAAQDPSGYLIAEPFEALNVFDMAAAAEKKLTEAHWAYLMTGCDDNYTVQANRDGFQRFQIRPRRFAYVHRGTTSLELLGERLTTPILLAPAGSQKAFHENGEIASALGASERGYQMILSCLANSHVKDVVEAHGSPVWFQLYPTRFWDVAEALIRKAEEAGCSKLVLTADRPVGGNHEMLQRLRRRDQETCQVCHPGGDQTYRSRRPNLQGTDYPTANAWPITWDFVDRVRRTTEMKLVIKGVMTAEDAEICVRKGIDAIIVSNHGGRQLESLMGTIEALPEVVQAVDGKIPVLVDGGFRRGTDIFKALALGADAICIGRPYLWGLSAFGKSGVSSVLSILRAELIKTMQLAGVTSLDEITPSFVRRRSSL